MRILIVSSMYPNCTNEITGTFVEEQAKELIRQGCEINVIAPIPYSPFPFNRIKKRWREYLKIPFREFREGIDICHPRYFTVSYSSIAGLVGDSLLFTSGWFMYWGIKEEIIRNIREFRPDIVHVHGVFPVGYAVALLKKSLKNNIKTVVTAHRGDVLIAFENKFVMNGARFCLNYSDFIIPVSRAIKDIIGSISDRSRIRVIPNGVDLRKFELTNEDVKWVEQKKREFNEKKLLLFVGWIIERKGIKELLEAFKRISLYRNDILLLLVGGIKEVGEVGMEKYLNDYINTNALNEKIKVVGPVKHEEVKLWINLCDIFILPSYSEGLPVAMLEAMSCGKPVIVSNVGGVGEVVKDRRNGLLIQPRNVDSLIKSIDFLLKNPDEARSLGNEAARTIFENYTWSLNAKKTIEVYKDILESQPKSSDLYMMNHCCIITTVHPPFDIRIFHKQAKSLVKEGYKVTLIAQHDRHEIVKGIEIIPLSSSNNRILRMLRTLIAFRLALKQKADVYHFHDPELIPVCLILKLLGKKVIYDVHEDYPSQIFVKYWIPEFLRKPVSIVVDIFERLSSKLFDGVVVANDSHKERFPKNKRVVISNFPTLEYFEELMKPREVPSEPPVAIYAGLLSRKRGIRQIVEAFSLLKGVDLWLVGGFEEKSFQEEIENSASSNVRILGIKPFEGVVKLLERANIGLSCFLPQPLYLNLVPTKIFEYMAAGIPVVASDFPIYREFVNGCGLLVDPLNPEDIARAVKQLLDNPELMRNMGKEGQRRVKEIYNWEQESQKLLSFYKEIGG